MMMANVDLLTQLQRWYASQCNGEWEHTYGIAIATLDNPGWSLKVDLSDTYLFNRAFHDICVESADGTDWYVCRVVNHTFEGACGPNDLSQVIAVFLNWADQPSS